MKNRLILLIVFILLIACKSKSGKHPNNHLKNDSIHINGNTINSVADSLNEEKGYASQTINENHFQAIELDDKLKQISATEYKIFDSLKTKTCDLDSNGFIKGLGLKIENNCADICETYLVENKSGKKMLLPTDFDTGIIGMNVSPQCTSFVTYSSYDLPDYDKYYDYRSLIMLYRIGKGAGLKTIRKGLTYGFKQWSISEVKWKDEKSIALKMYNDGHNDDIKYKYFQVKIL